MGNASSIALAVVLAAGLAGTDRTVQAPAPAPAAVSFLDAAPAIEGTLDPEVARLPARPLTLVSGQPPASVRPPSYRLAYTPRHLHVVVEMEADTLTQRDRAYQNGDGLILVVARPRPETAATEEFLVLGFSPGTPAARWQQRFVWYRNVALEMRGLEETVVAAKAEGGRAAFEVLIPWRELYPFHPWLSGGVGFNLCVTRALPDNARARYCAVDDPRVDSEQSPRHYEVLSFAAPRPASALEAVAILDRNHVRQGGSVRLKLALLAPAAGRTTVSVRALSGEGTRMAGRQVALDLAPGLHVHDIEVPTGSLPPAGYTVTWDLDGASPSGRLGLTVLPSSDAVSLRARLGKAQPRLRPGSVSTLRFQIDEIERQERRLHPQEVATALRLSLEQLLEDLAAAEAGTDVMAARTGILRRAFASKVDATLQPYSVRIPGNYRATTRYPLLVYLHGSGEDDRDQLTRTWFPDDFILVAPRARGTSNWYTADHAQDDIREAIDDACANYSVDRSRIVLMGFSMGGYGVYRTFLEDPKRYRALAVFSGIPRVPGGGSGAPDLLENESLLAAFRSMPMFVFHGGKDRNCPIEQTRSLVSRLEQAGATVAFHLEEDKGHEAPGAATLSAFHEWIRRIVR